MVVARPHLIVMWGAPRRAYPAVNSGYVLGGGAFSGPRRTVDVAGVGSRVTDGMEGVWFNDGGGRRPTSRALTSQWPRQEERLAVALHLLAVLDELQEDPGDWDTLLTGVRGYGAVDWDFTDDWAAGGAVKRQTLLDRLLAQAPASALYSSVLAVCHSATGAQVGRFPVLLRLLETSANAELHGGVAECCACLRAMVVLGANLGMVDDTGRTAWMAAARLFHVDTLAVLVEAGGDLSYADRQGWTLLMRVVDAGRYDAVVHLLGKISRGVELDHVATDGRTTALSLAQALTARAHSTLPGRSSSSSSSSTGHGRTSYDVPALARCSPVERALLRARRDYQAHQRAVVGAVSRTLLKLPRVLIDVVAGYVYAASSCGPQK